MKKIIFILSIILAIAMLSSCNIINKKGEVQKSTETDAVTTVQKTISEDEIEDSVKFYCNLATLEVFYHNVGEATKKPKTSLFHIGEIERTYWIEYTGSLKLGIDASKIQVTLNGEDVTVKIPHATVLGDPEIISEGHKSYITPDSWNKNEIDDNLKDQAVNEAQQKMIENVEADTTQLSRAESNAKSIIKGCIEKIGTENSINYNIHFEFME